MTNEVAKVVTIADVLAGNEQVATNSVEMGYKQIQERLERYVDAVDLDLKRIDQSELEAVSILGQKHLATCEQACVNYLRHSASRYDSILLSLSTPSLICSTKLECHVLHVERRSLVARLKKRVLDEIAREYPWLAKECLRQKARDGVEDTPGDFLMPFGPYKGRPLCEIESDYLIRLLGKTEVRRAVRTRIERHLAEREAGKEVRPP